MNQPVSTKSKAVEFAIAFFIWWAVSNFIFGVLLSRMDQPLFAWLPTLNARFVLIYYLLWFSTIITISVLYLIKSAWMASGVVAEVLITAGIWIVTLSIYSQGPIIYDIPIMIVPLPSGFRLFMGY